MNREGGGRGGRVVGGEGRVGKGRGAAAGPKTGAAEE